MQRSAMDSPQLELSITTELPLSKSATPILLISVVVELITVVVELILEVMLAPAEPGELMEGSDLIFEAQVVSHKVERSFRKEEKIS